MEDDRTLYMCSSGYLTLFILSNFLYEGTENRYNPLHIAESRNDMTQNENIVE